MRTSRLQEDDARSCFHTEGTLETLRALQSYSMYLDGILATSTPVPPSGSCLREFPLRTPHELELEFELEPPPGQKNQL